MNKYTSICLLSLCATPSAFAAVGSGLYLTAGIGAGWLDVNEVQDFDLDYQTLFSNIFVDDELNEAVLHNYNDSVVFQESTESVLAGRAAIGYLWDIFDGEPTKISNSVYIVRATLGLEAGYRLFEDVNTSTTKVVPPSQIGGYDTFETVSQKISNQAVDLSAVLRLPFTEDSRLAALIKAGVAYNMYDVDTTIDIEADTSPPPDPMPLPYNRTVHQSDDNNEFLPTVAGAIEYMIWDYVGISVEYNAIFGSDDADSQLLMGNLVIRI